MSFAALSASTGLLGACVLALAGASLCLFVQGPRLAGALGALIAIAASLSAWAGAARAFGASGELLTLGGWPAGFASGFLVDAFAGAGVFAALLLSAVSLFVSFGESDRPGSHPASFGLRLAWGGALAAALLAFDLLSQILWLLAAEIALVAVLALQGDAAGKALAVAGRWLLWRALGGVLALLGAALLYAAAGRLEPGPLAAYLNGAGGDARAALGLGLLAAGLLTLGCAAPLQGALAGALRAGRLSVGLLAVGGALAAWLLLMRLGSVLLAADRADALYLLALLAAICSLFASLQLAAASSLARIAGFGFAAQSGAFLLATAGGAFGPALLHALVSGLATLAVLAGAKAIGGGGDAPLARQHGAGRKAPLAAAVVVVGALSYASVPFTAGFVSRVGLLEMAADRNWALAAALLTLPALSGLWAGARCISILFLNTGPEGADRSRLAWRVLPVGVAAALACVAYGFLAPPEGLALLAVAVERSHGR